MCCSAAGWKVYEMLPRGPLMRKGCQLRMHLTITEKVTKNNIRRVVPSHTSSLEVCYRDNPLSITEQ